MGEDETDYYATRHKFANERYEMVNSLIKEVRAVYESAVKVDEGDRGGLRTCAGDAISLNRVVERLVREDRFPYPKLTMDLLVFIHRKEDREPEVAEIYRKVVLATLEKLEYERSAALDK